MENFKFIISSIFIIGLLGFAGYWAFTTLENGSTHIDAQKLVQLEKDNEELNKELIKLKKDIVLLEADKDLLIQNGKNTIENTVNEPTATTVKTTSLKYQSLINDIQKLIDGNIYLKNKSQGAAVGTVQTFLNLYNNTSNKVDNDYGFSTFNAVKIFQKSQGITADGETGPGTYKKMITWLKNR